MGQGDISFDRSPSLSTAGLLPVCFGGANGSHGASEQQVALLGLGAHIAQAFRRRLPLYGCHGRRLGVGSAWCQVKLLPMDGTQVHATFPLRGNFITDPSEGQDSGGGLAVSENACLGCGLGGCMGCNGNGCYGCALGCTGCPSCGSCGYGCGCQGCPGFQACEGCQACPGYQPIAACDGSQGCPGYQACGGCQACQGYPCQGCDASQAYGCLGCGCDLQACPGCQGFYQPVQGCEAFQACGAYGCGGCDLAAFGCQDGAALAGCACNLARPAVGVAMRGTGAVDMTNKILGAAPGRH